MIKLAILAPGAQYLYTMSLCHTISRELDAFHPTKRTLFWEVLHSEQFHAFAARDWCSVKYTAGGVSYYLVFRSRRSVTSFKL